MSTSWSAVPPSPVSVSKLPPLTLSPLFLLLHVHAQTNQPPSPLVPSPSIFSVFVFCRLSSVAHPPPPLCLVSRVPFDRTIYYIAEIEAEKQDAGCRMPRPLSPAPPAASASDSGPLCPLHSASSPAAGTPPCVRFAGPPPACSMQPHLGHTLNSHPLSSFLRSPFPFSIWWCHRYNPAPVLVPVPHPDALVFTSPQPPLSFMSAALSLLPPFGYVPVRRHPVLGTRSEVSVCTAHTRAHSQVHTHMNNHQAHPTPRSMAARVATHVPMYSKNHSGPTRFLKAT